MAFQHRGTGDLHLVRPIPEQVVLVVGFPERQEELRASYESASVKFSVSVARAADIPAGCTLILADINLTERDELNFAARRARVQKIVYLLDPTTLLSGMAKPSAPRGKFQLRGHKQTLLEFVAERITPSQARDLPGELFSKILQQARDAGYTTTRRSVRSAILEVGRSGRFV